MVSRGTHCSFIVFNHDSLAHFEVLKGCRKAYRSENGSLFVPLREQIICGIGAVTR